MATSASCPQDEQNLDKNTIGVVLLGKSGIGKSALGNSLLGEKKFKTSLLENKGTYHCQIESRLLDDGTTFMITDTPGYFRITRTDQEIIGEYEKGFALLKQGPCVFILVLSLNERFTGDEDDTMEFVGAVFGEEVFNHMIVVFTGLDSFYDDTDPEIPVNLETILPPGSKHILSKCTQRYTCINNRTDQNDKMKSIRQIFVQIKSLAEINNSWYFMEKALMSGTNKCQEISDRRKQRIEGDGGATYRSVGADETGWFDSAYKNTSNVISGFVNFFLEKEVNSKN